MTQIDFGDEITFRHFYRSRIFINQRKQTCWEDQRFQRCLPSRVFPSWLVKEALYNKLENRMEHGK